MFLRKGCGGREAVAARQRSRVRRRTPEQARFPRKPESCVEMRPEKNWGDEVGEKYTAFFYFLSFAFSFVALARKTGVCFGIESFESSRQFSYFSTLYEVAQSENLR